MTPRKEDVDSLLTLPRAWADDYQGVKGWWFGINDAAKATQSPDGYLFLSAGTGGTAGYWTQTYGTQNNPQSFWLMPTQLIEEDLVAYSTPLNMRCIKKPQKVYQPIDIGFDFLIAPGNLVAEGSLGNVPGYRFAEEQGWFSEDYANGGDYFCFGTTDPFVSKGIEGPFVDPCKEMGGTWRTPTPEELAKIFDSDYYGNHPLDPPVTPHIYGTYTY